MRRRGICPPLPRRLFAAVLTASFALPAAAWAQQAQLTFDRNDPEIRAFLSQRTAAPRALAAEEADLNLIKLPVLAFDAVPGLVQRSLSAGVSPRRERTLVTDPNNPVWYTIEDDYGDITVIVNADTRIMHTFPEGTPVAPEPADTSRAAGISVMDREIEPGIQGLTAEYTIYKFPDIPYTVTIECAEHLREQCRDLGALAQDQDNLRLIAVPPE